MKNDIIIRKSGFVLSEKGIGISCGGALRTNLNKPGDECFFGLPNTTKKPHFYGKRGGYDRETKYDENSRAILERRYTDHDTPAKYTNPHDHEISWDNPRRF